MSNFITAFKLTLNKASFSLFCKKKKITVFPHNMQKLDRKWYPTQTGKVNAKTPQISVFNVCPVKVDHTFLEYPVNLGQKKVICFSFSENSLGSCSMWGRGLSSKAGRKLHSPSPWRNIAPWVTMTIPKRAALFWNTTVHSPHRSWGFNNDKNLPIAVCFLSFPLKIPNSGCYREPKLKYSKACLGCPFSQVFSSAAFICPPFPFSETREKIL